MADRYLVIQDDVVVNVVLWDGASDWTPPEGSEAVLSNDAAVGWVRREDGSLVAPARPEPQLPTAEELKAMIAARRFVAETSGITINGLPLDTGRDSQGLIAGAALQAVIDPQYSVRWKMVGGEFVELSAQQIIGVATAVRAHVQACFDREADLLTELDAGTLVDSMIEEGWPDGSVPAPPAG
ncbi:hypothetical protein FQZ97_466130 [compost metagenome]